VEQIEVDTPVGIAAVGGDVWVASAGDNELVRIDAQTRQVAATVAVGDTPLRLAYDGSLLWVSVFGDDTVVAVDPLSNAIVTSVPLEGQPEGLAVGFDSLWVVRQQARQLTRLAPDGTVVASYPLGEQPRLVTVADAYVFVSNFGDGTVTRLDPATGELATTGELCDGAQGLASEADVLWVTCTAAGRLLALDQDDLLVTGSLDLPDEPDAVHVIDGAVWVAEASGPAMVRIGGDATAPTVDLRHAFGTAGGLRDRANVDFVAHGRLLWVTAPQSDAVLIGEPS
jgi:YVTN family beta-propeller protein